MLSARAVRAGDCSLRPFGQRGAVKLTIKAEYIWIDGTEPTPLLRSKTKVLVAGDRPAHLGLRRFEHQSGPGQGIRLRAQAGLLLPRPHPGRGQRAGAVRGAAHRLHPAPDQHPRLAGRGGREVRRAGAAVRHRAGVHPLQGQPAARLPGAHRVPRRPRARTTAASAPTTSTAGPSSRPTSTPAWPPAWRSRASTPRSCPVSGSSRSARSARSRSPTSCGSPAGCCTAWARISGSP